MNKRTFGIVALGMLAFTSCGVANDTDKLAGIFGDYACRMHAIVNEAMANPEQLALVMQKRTEVENQLEADLRKTFPDGEERAREAYKQVTKEEFRALLAEKAKASCNAPDEIIDGAASELED